MIRPHRASRRVERQLAHFAANLDRDLAKLLLRQPALREHVAAHLENVVRGMRRGQQPEAPAPAGVREEGAV